MTEQVLGQFTEYSQWNNGSKVTLPEKLLWKGEHPKRGFQEANHVDIWQISERVRSLKSQMSLADIVELMVENSDLEKARLTFSINESFPGSVSIEANDLVMRGDASHITFRGDGFKIVDGEIDQSESGSDLMEILASDNFFLDDTQLYLSQDKIFQWIADGGDFSVLMTVLEKDF